MSRHTRFIAALLTVLLMLTVCTSLTVFAANEDGEGPQESIAEQQNENSGSGESGGNADAHENEGGDDDQQPDDDGSHNRDDDPGYRYDNDNDYDNDSYQENQDNQDNQDNRNNNRDRETENESVMYVYYDSDGNEYSNPEDMYVGGDQTYTPPVSTPSTTAALYDTANTRVDENTLSNSDWADISKKLRTANAAPVNDAGDFAFIQKNTDTGDNGHWMLILGFTLITLGIIGFIYLVAKAGSRKRALAHYTAEPDQTAQQPRYRTDEEGYGDDFDADGSGS